MGLKNLGYKNKPESQNFSVLKIQAYVQHIV
jgi:hypothetical protein